MIGISYCTVPISTLVHFVNCKFSSIHPSSNASFGTNSSINPLISSFDVSGLSLIGFKTPTYSAMITHLLSILNSLANSYYLNSVRKLTSLEKISTACSSLFSYSYFQVDVELICDFMKEHLAFYAPFSFFI